MQTAKTPRICESVPFTFQPFQIHSQHQGRGKRSSQALHPRLRYPQGHPPESPTSIEATVLERFQKEAYYQKITYRPLCHELEGNFFFFFLNLAPVPSALTSDVINLTFPEEKEFWILLLTLRTRGFLRTAGDEGETQIRRELLSKLLWFHSTHSP